MSITTLHLGLWTLGLLLQGLCVAYCIRHMLSPFAYWRWRLVWVLRWVGDLCIFYRGVRFLVLLNQDGFDVAPDTIDWLDATTQFVVSGCFLVAHYLMASIFDKPLRLAPQFPAEVVIDTTSRILRWNLAASTMFGWTAAEALGHDLATLVIPERYQEAHRQGMARWLAQDQEGPYTLRTYRTEAQRKDGREIEVKVDILPVVQPDGTFQFHGTIYRMLPL